MPKVAEGEFEKLNPFQRGYAAYMFGSRDDEPFVPDEDCPYPDGSTERLRWMEGQSLGVLHAIDSEE